MTVTVWTRLLLGCVTIVAAIFTAKGVSNALGAGGSQDFQWSPTGLFVDGENPYLAWLSGSDAIILAQAPNYTPGIYISLVPLGVLPFQAAKIVWVACNILMAAAAAIMLARRVGWTWIQTALLVVAFFAATPVRVTISNGQQSMLVLIAAVLAFLVSSTAPRSVALAITLFKHSLGAPLLVAQLLRRQLASVFGAVAITLVFLGLFSLAVRTPPWEVVMDLLNVNSSTVPVGVGDVMSVVEVATGADGASSAVFAAGVAGFLISCFVLARLMKHGSWLAALSAASLVSLVAFKHLEYDFVFLLPVAVYAAVELAGWRQRIVLGVCLYFAYVYWLITKLTSSELILTVSSCALLVAAIAAIASAPHVSASARAVQVAA